MIQLLLGNDKVGRTSTYQTLSVVANLNKEDKVVPICSVVLSSQHVESSEVVFTTTTTQDKRKNAAVGTFIHNGPTLVLSVTRVFNINQKTLFYLQAYKNPPPGNPPPI